MTRHQGRYLARWELAGVGGAVVVVDVIRAFTTAAPAFGSGVAEIDFVGDVEEASAFKIRPTSNSRVPSTRSASPWRSNERAPLGLVLRCVR